MKKFTCGIIWIDGGARNQDCKDRATARTYIESLERTRPNRSVPNIYVATTAGMGSEPGHYKIFQQVESGWIRDRHFEREILFHEERARQIKLQKERLEQLELSQQIVGHSHQSKTLQGAKAKVMMNGKEMSFGDGEVSFMIHHGSGKVEEYQPPESLAPIEFTIELKAAAPSDEDIEKFRKQFDNHVNSAKETFRTPIEEPKLTQEDIENAMEWASRNFSLGPDKLVGGGPLMIEDLAFPKTEDRKETSDHDIDELYRALGIKK